MWQDGKKKVADRTVANDLIKVHTSVTKKRTFSVTKTTNVIKSYQQTAAAVNEINRIKRMSVR